MTRRGFSCRGRRRVGRRTTHEHRRPGPDAGGEGGRSSRQPRHAHPDPADRGRNRRRGGGDNRRRAWRHVGSAQVRGAQWRVRRVPRRLDLPAHDDRGAREHRCHRWPRHHEPRDERRPASPDRPRPDDTLVDRGRARRVGLRTLLDRA
ncbi:hypothetical protein ACFPRL_22550 [Pseudoclavibacter helvolus]